MTNDVRASATAARGVRSPTGTLVAEEAPLDWLRELAGRRPTPLYAVIDACDEIAVAQRAHAAGERAVSLYRGWAEQEYWAIAPYLFEVDEETLDWIIASLWDKPWGIFVVASMDLESVRRHLRHFLIVEDPDGAPMYFRFYDPRAARAFLFGPDFENVQAFLGPLEGVVLAEAAAEARFLTIQSMDGY